MMEQKLICNGCGRSLEVNNGILREDVFEGKKQWGYFSERDGEIHSFLLCESCYDKMIQGFLVAPLVKEATEL